MRLQFFALVILCVTGVLTELSHNPPDYGDVQYPTGSKHYNDGYYIKKCAKGYRPDDQGGCIDEDECRTPLITCGLWADCINTPGSYKCVCHSGYKHEYGKCVDRDECTDYSNLCTINENCINTIGAYFCICKPGYFRYDDYGCQKIGFKHKDKDYPSYYPDSHKPPSVYHPDYAPQYPKYHDSAYKDPDMKPYSKDGVYHPDYAPQYPKFPDSAYKDPDMKPYSKDGMS